MSVLCGSAYVLEEWHPLVRPLKQMYVPAPELWRTAVKVLLHFSVSERRTQNGNAEKRKKKKEMNK